MNLKKLLNVVIISVFFCFYSFFVQSAELQCERINKAILDSASDEDIYPFMEKRNDIGIIYDYEWDTESRLISIKRNEKNYPIIRFSLFNKNILPGQAVKTFNGIDLSSKKDDEIMELHKSLKKAQIQLVDESNEIIINPDIYLFNNYKLFNFDLTSVNEIDTRKGIFETTFEATLTYERPDLLIYAKKINLTEECPIFDETFDSKFWPIGQEIFFNEYKYDVDIRKSEYPLITYDNGVVNTIRDDYGIGQFRNEFDFRKFPFDKQDLKIKIHVKSPSTTNLEALPLSKFPAITLITPDINAFIGLEKYKNNNYLKEWKVIETNIYNTFKTTEHVSLYTKKFVNGPRDILNIEVKLERNSGFYLYKIIIPVFLILLVAWSVLWIPTPQIESRLTTSIVSLLALIAYNFVFHDDIPKLEYLTNLDKYILLSYLFCAIPTFMSIFLSRTVGIKPKRATLINQRMRIWGGIIYIAQVFLIFST